MIGNSLKEFTKGHVDGNEAAHSRALYGRRGGLVLVERTLVALSRHLGQTLS